MSDQHVMSSGASGNKFSFTVKTAHVSMHRGPHSTKILWGCDEVTK